MGTRVCSGPVGHVLSNPLLPHIVKSFHFHLHRYSPSFCTLILIFMHCRHFIEDAAKHCICKSHDIDMVVTTQFFSIWYTFFQLLPFLLYIWWGVHPSLVIVVVMIQDTSGIPIANGCAVYRRYIYQTFVVYAKEWHFESQWKNIKRCSEAK